MMDFGSVCSGIEAASVAFGPLGWKAAWFSEIEPFPSGVLAHHYPDVPNLGDMTDLPRRILSGEVPAPSMLCGGTPCQSFSIAGLRNSLNDKRGNLSLTFCEIANAIDHVRAKRGDEPGIILWENVFGVLSTQDNAFGCFLAALVGESEPLEPAGRGWTDAGAVYGPTRTAAWRVLDAQYFGLAQRRRRLFVVASARNGFDPAAVLFESEGVRRDFAPSREAGEETAASAIQSVAGSLDTQCGGGKLTHQSVNNGHLIGTITARMFNSFGSRDVEAGALREDGLGVRRLTPVECERLQGFPTVTELLRFDVCIDRQSGCVDVALSCRKWQNSASAGLSSTSQAWLAPLAALHMRIGYEPSALVLPSHAMSMSPADGADFSSAYRPLPLHANIAQQLARAVPDLASEARNGEAASPAVIRLSFPGSDGSAPATLSGGETEASAGGALSAQSAGTFTASELGRVLPASGTTTETLCCSALAAIARCIPGKTLPERFSIEVSVESDYTAIPWRNKPLDQCPDSLRYKALGNSWAVPCVRWIGERIRRQIERRASA
jgi:DNA (cytosine-5)-methyltransferase 1